MVKKHSISFVNTATTYSQNTTSYASGRVLAIQYIKSTGTAISSTADLTITTVSSSQVIFGSLAVSTGFMKCPRLPVVNTTNGAIANESAPIPVADERIKVAVSKSTSTGQSGTFNIWVG